MGKDISVSESDMKTLQSEFNSCKELAFSIGLSLYNMKSCIIDEVYGSLAISNLRVMFDKMMEAALVLSNVNDALDLYTAATLAAFKKTDEEAGDDADNVAKTG